MYLYIFNLKYINSNFLLKLHVMILKFPVNFRFSLIHHLHNISLIYSIVKRTIQMPNVTFIYYVPIDFSGKVEHKVKNSEKIGKIISVFNDN